MRAIECVLVVACVLLKAHAAEPSCPVCSKYHYEANVLERMIRNEIKWEQIVNDIKVINDKLNSALQVIGETSVKTEHLTSRLEKQKQVVDEASVKIENLTLGLEKQKLDVDIKSHRSQNLTNVLFYARTPKSASLALSEIAIFTAVGVNTGQGYDTNTGKFTAPVSGVYMFAVQYCAEAGNWGCLQIVKNGSSLQNSVNMASSSGRACSSMQAFATVAVGEQVWVRSNGWTAACYLYDYNPQAASSFAGVLIHT